MNFIDGVVRGTESGAVFDCGEFSFALDPALARVVSGNASKDVTYGVRAEDVGVTTQPKEGGVEVTVFGSELMGSEQFVHGMKEKLKIVARAPMEFQAPIGTSVWIDLASPKAHLFDAKTEKALI